MARAKGPQGEKNKKAEEPSDVAPVLPKAPYVGLSNLRHQKTRMRIRDHLAETNANMDAELVAQDIALEAGFQVTAPLTMTKQDMANAAETLVGMKKLWSGISPMTSKTDTKLIEAINEAVVKLAGMASLAIKAYTPEEKEEAAKTLVEDQAELAALLAKVKAAESVLGA